MHPCLLWSFCNLPIHLNLYNNIRDPYFRWLIAMFKSCEVAENGFDYASYSKRVHQWNQEEQQHQAQQSCASSLVCQRCIRVLDRIVSHGFLAAPFIPVMMSSWRLEVNMLFSWITWSTSVCNNLCMLSQSLPELLVRLHSSIVWFSSKLVILGPLGRSSSSMKKFIKSSRPTRLPNQRPREGTGTPC